LRVLGIDPGTRFTGYGVVEQRGRHLAHVGHGVIRLDAQSALEQRLDAIFRGLGEAAELYRPDEVAVEGVFTFRNARSALVLGHARGVALLVAAQRDLPVYEYPPARVKKSVGAGGASDKDGVSRMVRAFLALPDLVDQRADASDALAVAICHLNRSHRAFVGRPAGPRREGARAFAAMGDRLRPAFHRPTLRRAGEDQE
jgi:crossover junction endodeoxyribonuclease RuvC